MLFNIKHMRTWWPLATLIATLTLAGCSDDDRKGIITPSTGSGEVFHGAEWATIKNLDPRGEQCIDCHGKSADMSPNGKLAHNIGLQKNDSAKSLGVEGIEITKVMVNETTGEVTVTLNQAIPAGASFGLTFAKLAPRVIHNRGHDWQNYFASSDLAFGERRKASQGIEMMLKEGGAQPLLAPNPKVNGNTITFNLGDGDNRSWGKHSFSVKSAYETDTNTYEYENITGTKVTTTDLANNIYCDDAAAGNGTTQPAANQTPVKSSTSGKNPVCWWPDGTHLPAGVFVTNANELVVQYQPDYTHRLALIINGSPGHNVWYDFVPSVANGDKTPNDLKHADLALTEVSEYVKADGRVIAADYELANGRGIPGSSDNNAAEVAKHQTLPAARDVVDVQSCNSCHDSLSMHGGSRSQTQTCVTCHNPGNLQASSGRSMDFKVLIHRIHRGVNLPSENADIKGQMTGDKTLVSTAATDFTKVRFPQGPTPGEADGITNCVKCHMGSETKQLVQALADDIGAPNYNVQASMKLAKVTPQGDNWLAVRNVNACQACHDSNVWIANGSINSNNKHRTGNPTDTDPTDHSIYQLDKYMPFYGNKYSDIGYKWLGKKQEKNQDAGWVHNTAVPDNNGRFTCGSSGGCHSNTPITGLNVKNIGNPIAQVSGFGGLSNTNAIQDVHLRLTRDFIIAERFAIEINDPKVTGTTFTADVNIKDKKTGNNLTFDSALKTTPDADIGELSLFGFLSNGYIGWMHNSPDYNHSAGHNNSLPFLDIPGAPALAAVDWVNGKINMDLADMPNNQWATIKDDLANVVGTLFVRANFNEGYTLQATNVDFRFNNQPVADDGRRIVVDFTAGNGPVNIDNVDGWDKHNGANTQSCSSCHLQLSFHGGLANNVQACVVCHNPQRTDINGRSVAGKTQKDYADGQYEESLDFKRFVHAIHSAGDGFRQDPLIHDTGFGAPDSRPGDKSNSFPGVLSNCQSCHIKDADSGLWTFELDQIPDGMIGSTAITADWSSIVPSSGNYDPDNKRSDFDNHLKMTPIASVCSSCHDAGYITKPTEGRQNANILDGGPYVGSHWWVMGGIAPGIVRPGELPSKTKHQSGL